MVSYEAWAENTLENLFMFNDFDAAGKDFWRWRFLFQGLLSGGEKLGEISKEMKANREDEDGRGEGGGDMRRLEHNVIVWNKGMGQRKRRDQERSGKMRWKEETGGNHEESGKMIDRTRRDCKMQRPYDHK